MKKRILLSIRGSGGMLKMLGSFVTRVSQIVPGRGLSFCNPVLTIVHGIRRNILDFLCPKTFDRTLQVRSQLFDSKKSQTISPRFCMPIVRNGLLVLLLITALNAIGYAEVPLRINYQGRLKENGLPVNGTKTMNFRIWNVQSGGAWGSDGIWQSGDQSVVVSSGLFNYTMQVPSNVGWRDLTPYLEVTMDGGDSVILSPRERIGASVYAFYASSANYAFNATEGGGWVDGGTTVKLITASDKVGIGIDAATAILHISSNTAIPSQDMLKVSTATTGGDVFIVEGDGDSRIAGDLTVVGSISSGAGGVVTGSGTENYITKWSAGGSSIENSLIYDDGTNVGIGVAASPGYELDVSGHINATDAYLINGSTVVSVAGSESVLVGVNAGTGNTGNYLTAIGYNAGPSNTGNNNTFIGRNAGQDNAGGGDNVYIGQAAAANNVTGGGNVVIGSGAGSVSSGTGAVFIGYRAGQNASNWANTIIGNEAGTASLGSGGNVLLGSHAGDDVTGADNTMLGHYAGYNANGAGNIFIGHDAGTGLTTDNKLYIENSSANQPLIYGEFDNDKVTIFSQLGVGTTDYTSVVEIQDTTVAPSDDMLVVSTATTGGDVFIVEGDGDSRIAGDLTVVGSISSGAGGVVTGSGTENYITKWSAGGSSIENSLIYDDGTNVGIGVAASPTRPLDVSGHINATDAYQINGSTVLSISGTENVFVGQNAGLGLTTGYRNVFVGRAAGYANDEGYRNVFIGNSAGIDNTGGDDNVFIGNNAGQNNVGGSGSVCIGSASGEQISGAGAVFIGYRAGQSATQSQNTIIGNEAGTGNLSGSGNVFIGGGGVGAATTSGGNNTYVGHQSGSAATGSGNIFLGHDSGQNITSSNKLYIENSNANQPLIYGEFDNDAVTIFNTLGVGTTDYVGDFALVVDGGITRYGNTTYAVDNSTTYVNLGYAGQVGTNGQDYQFCTVGGGRENVASNNFSTVSGGLYNRALGAYAVIGGGLNNYSSGGQTTVSGGEENYSTAAFCTVSGGRQNTASGGYSAVGGGYLNTAFSYATVAGGRNNSALGDNSVVLGGRYNKATADDSFIIGAGTSGSNYLVNNTTMSLIAGFNGIPMLFVSSYTVGVGITNPRARFHVEETGVIPSTDMLVVSTATTGGDVFIVEGDGDSRIAGDLTVVGSISSGAGGVVTGSGTENYITKWDSSGQALQDSLIYDDGTNVGIGVGTSPTRPLDVSGHINTSESYQISGSTLISIVGTERTLVGLNAGHSSSGDNLTTFGYNAGAANTGNNNTFIGHDAGEANQGGASNVFVGAAAGDSNQTGGSNVLIGASAGQGGTDIAASVIIGSGAGFNATNDDNVFIGYESGWQSTGGSNVMIGYNSGRDGTGTTGNVIIGRDAGNNISNGDYNILLGRNAGFNVGDGGSNVFIGYQAGYNVSSSNKLYIENSNANQPLIYGEFDNDKVTIFDKLSVGTTDYTSVVHIEDTTVAPSDDMLVVSTATTGGDVFIVEGDGDTRIGGDLTVVGAISSDGNSLVDASGPPNANYVARWSDSDTLVDSVIQDNGTNVGIGVAGTSDVRLTIDGAILKYGSSMAAIDVSTISTHINLGSDSTTGNGGGTYGYCTVGGGQYNTAMRRYATVSGGLSNTAGIEYTFIGGGFNNYAEQSGATVGGGLSNTAVATYTAIAGGIRNTITSLGTYSFIGGGYENTSADSYAAIAGGAFNRVLGQESFVGGGNSNFARGDYAAILGGRENSTNGNYSTVSGGYDNSATGEYDWAGGRYMLITGSRTFAWGYAASPVTIPADDSFIMYGVNVGIGHTNPSSLLHLEKTGVAPSDDMIVVSTATTGGDVFIVEGDGDSRIAGDLTVVGSISSGAGGVVTGSGTENYITKWSAGGSSIENSLIYDDGTNVGIGVAASPTRPLDVSGHINATDAYQIGGSTVVSIVGSECVLVGENAGAGNTGTDVTAIGFNAGLVNTGNANTFIGHDAGEANAAATRNTYIGAGAGDSNATGGDSVFVGYCAGQLGDDIAASVIMGSGAGFNATNDNNVFIGYESGFSNTGSGSVMIGYAAGRDGTATGSNVFIGNGAGRQVSTGGGNVIIGQAAGYYVDSGASNVFIGYNAAQNISSSNKLYIENSSANQPLIYGEFDNDKVTIFDKLSVGTTDYTSVVHIEDTTVAPSDDMLVVSTATTGGDVFIVEADGDTNIEGDLTVAGSVSSGGSSLVTGSGTDNYITKWQTGGSVLANSLIYDDGTNVGINTAGPRAELTINGGILQNSSTAYGTNADTHVNLGHDGKSGTSGQNYSYATVGGGYQNIANHDYAVVSGGDRNTTSDSHAAVAGGSQNTAGGMYSFIGGGETNTSLGAYTTIGGGNINRIANTMYSVIAGGSTNSIGDQYSAIGGGEMNTITSMYSTIAGGNVNTVLATNGTVGGGYLNKSTGSYATVPGGAENTAGGDYSFAAGRGMVIDPAGDNTFLWGYSATPITPITASDAFIVYSGNVGIGHTNPSSLLHMEKTGVAPSDDMIVVSTATTEGNVFIVEGDGDTRIGGDLTVVGTLSSGSGTLVDVTGTPTANYIPKWNDANTLEQSIIYDDGTNVGIGVGTSPTRPLDVSGHINATDAYQINGSTVLSIAGGGNVTIGENTGSSMNIATAERNVIIGSLAATGGTNTNPGYSVIIGYNAGHDINDGGYNVFVGPDAGRYVQDTGNNVFIGNQAGGGANESATALSTNIMIGNYAGAEATSNNNVLIGRRAGNTISLGTNVMIGYDSGRFATSATGNVFLGNNSGAGTSGNDITGDRNVVLGQEAGQNMTSATDNVFIGYQAAEGTDPNFIVGDDNVIIGRGAGQYMAGGASNVFIGYQAGQNISSSNKLYIENSNANQPLIYGEFDNDAVTIFSKLGIGTTDYVEDFALVVDGGITRLGNTTYAVDNSTTYVNLGYAGQVGNSGQDYVYCTVGGGRENMARHNYTTVSGGLNNAAAYLYGTIGGGQDNYTSGGHATVSGGFENFATAAYCSVGGGRANTTNTGYATVGGGSYNTASLYATISGGRENMAKGQYSTVSGGYDNSATGEYDWAGGRYMLITGSRTFAWGYAASPVTIPADDSFIMYGVNVGIGHTNPSSLLHLEKTGVAPSDDMIVVSTATSGGDVFIVEADGDSRIAGDLTVIGTISSASSYVDASGTPGANYVAKWNDSDTLEQSVIYDDGTNVGIGTETTDNIVDIAGNVDVTGVYKINDSTAVSMSGTRNFFAGYNAGISNQCDASGGTDNVFVGHSAGEDNVTGDQNTFIGRNAGASNTGGANVYIGYASADENLNTSQNVIIGAQAGTGESSTADDLAANVMIGYGAGGSATSDNNVLVGRRAGDKVTSASNVMLGYNAGIYATSAAGNVFIGNEAGEGASGQEITGDYNVVLGYRAGENMLGGSRNVFLGYQAGQNETGDDKLYIENSNSSTPLIYGEFDNDRVVINDTLSVGTTTSDQARFQVAGGSFTVLSNGNVGIGTDNPLWKFAINLEDGTTAFIMDSAGDVAVGYEYRQFGTPVPEHKFEVYDDVDGGYASMRIANTNSQDGARICLEEAYTSVRSGFDIIYHSDSGGDFNALYFSGGNGSSGYNTRMSIRRDILSVGIGIEDPTAVLHISSEAAVASADMFKISTAATNGDVFIVEADGDTRIEGALTVVGSISQGGNGLVDVSGTPGTNYIAKWNDSNTLEQSLIYDDGTNVGIGGALKVSDSTIYSTALSTTHVNVGANSISGTNGQNYGYVTVGGGLDNTATHSYGTVGGGYSNQVVEQAGTIAGGYNNAAAELATVAGGQYNNASGYAASVGGGDNNIASGQYGAIGGGFENSIASQWMSVIAGGRSNAIDNQYASILGGLDNAVSGDFGSIGGGLFNVASGGTTTVAGGSKNTASGLLSTVGGGGSNISTGTYCTVSGGYLNSASHDYATVGGGWQNSATNQYATVSGGYLNKALDIRACVGGGIQNTASGSNATIAGGYYNTVQGAHSSILGGTYNSATGSEATVAGGERNTATSDHSFIGGGTYNIASGATSTIAGGCLNLASALASTVGGGNNNTASEIYAAVSGGEKNTASGSHAVVGGGDQNTASGSQSTIAGGQTNTATGTMATIAGGNLNRALNYSVTVGGGRLNTASEQYATVGGGYSNRAIRDYVVIGGGAYNTASGNRSFVGGGNYNIASGATSTISGGCQNTAQGLSSVVSGGYGNSATAVYSVVGGGENNKATSDNAFVGGGEGNSAGDTWSAVVGGTGNIATGSYSFIGGGVSLRAQGDYSTISGGLSNTAYGARSTVGGGDSNKALGYRSIIGGGYLNTVSGQYDTIGGGQYNIASGTESFVGGGDRNSATGLDSVVSGGYYNTATNTQSTVVGGLRNIASGEYSTAMGFYSDASLRGETAHANGRFASTGDAQYRRFVLRRDATGSGQTYLSLDGTGQSDGINTLDVPNNTIWHYVVQIVGCNTSQNLYAGYTVRGTIVNDGGATSIVGSNQVDAFENVARGDGGVNADNNNDNMRVYVYGDGTYSMKWVAIVHVTQVTF